MRQWKVAISLAIVGAVAAPFVFRTWKIPQTSYVRVPLTAEERKNYAADMERTNNCQTMPQTGHRPDETKTFAKIQDEVIAEMTCKAERASLERNAEFRPHLALPKYLAINLAVALAAFAGIFGLRTLNSHANPTLLEMAQSLGRFSAFAIQALPSRSPSICHAF